MSVIDILSSPPPPAPHQTNKWHKEIRNETTYIFGHFSPLHRRRKELRVTKGNNAQVRFTMLGSRCLLFYESKTGHNQQLEYNTQQQILWLCSNMELTMVVASKEILCLHTLLAAMTMFHANNLGRSNKGGQKVGFSAVKYASLQLCRTMVALCILEPVSLCHTPSIFTRQGDSIY